MSIVLPWDLDRGNIKAISYVELCVASPLLPPPLEDVNRYPHFPGLYSIGSSHVRNPHQLRSTMILR
ncbi:hypothetical protein F5876DRAFT_84239 [Lentinula aff. lateritia]|uniref:Uncharacterized protein n=1 Tax=Lentinula aff. lateritia TaxID=2804960 RepID=A0ACC1TGI7_9AGAR|nr:hypothetical protein F5876DRAFT_84239 [Lentinula aff. lateritia]